MTNYYFLAFKKYAVFEGRATRKEYWYFQLFNSLISVLIVFLLNPLLSEASHVYSLVGFIPTIAVAIRRLHDTGRSAWLMLIGLIPIVGWLVLIYFFVQPSDEGVNAHGG